MIFNFKFTKDAKTLGGHSADEFLKTGDTASNSEKLDGHKADEFFKNSGGTVNGDIKAKKEGNVDAGIWAQNGLARFGLFVQNNGTHGLYDADLGKWILDVSQDGSAVKLYGTASGNLPLTGGKVDWLYVYAEDNNVPMRLYNLKSNNVWTQYHGMNSELLGWLGFDGKNNPCFWGTENGIASQKRHTLHHDGNSAKVHIGTAAPSDTSALWVDISA